MQETWETQVWSLGLEDSLEKEIATLLRYSCLENPMDRGGWNTTQTLGLQRARNDWSDSMTTILLYF